MLLRGGSALDGQQALRENLRLGTRLLRETSPTWRKHPGCSRHPPFHRAEKQLFVEQPYGPIAALGDPHGVNAIGVGQGCRHSFHAGLRDFMNSAYLINGQHPSAPVFSHQKAHRRSRGIERSITYQGVERNARKKSPLTAVRPNKISDERCGTLGTAGGMISRKATARIPSQDLPTRNTRYAVVAVVAASFFAASNCVHDSR